MKSIKEKNPPRRKESSLPLTKPAHTLLGIEVMHTHIPKRLPQLKHCSLDPKAVHLEKEKENSNLSKMSFWFTKKKINKSIEEG